MKIALDPYMLRKLPIAEMIRTMAEIGYEYIELSPRDDFMPFFLHPRADNEKVTELRRALRETPRCASSRGRSAPSSPVLSCSNASRRNSPHRGSAAPFVLTGVKGEMIGQASPERAGLPAPGNGTVEGIQLRRASLREPVDEDGFEFLLERLA
jgi:hypothetical protein